MDIRRLATAAILLVFAACVVLLIVEQARAQDDDWTDKKGMGSIFDRKKEDGAGTTLMQKCIGIGSVVIMIGVLKWA